MTRSLELTRFRGLVETWRLSARGEESSAENETTVPARVSPKAIRLVRASEEERFIPKVGWELGVTAETLRN